FEARLSLVEVLESPSIFFKGMAGSRIPIAVAHGEGFADFSQRGDPKAVHRAMRFVDHAGQATEAYPATPTATPHALTAPATPPPPPQRRPGGPRRRAHRRRPLHRADAAPRARVPQPADELDERGSLSAQPVDADVWECEGELGDAETL